MGVLRVWAELRISGMTGGTQASQCSVFVWLNGSGLETSGYSTHEEDCHGSSQVLGCPHHMSAQPQPREWGV